MSSVELGQIVDISEVVAECVSVSPPVLALTSGRGGLISAQPLLQSAVSCWVLSAPDSLVLRNGV